jgi:hypothetical protein
MPAPGTSAAAGQYRLGHAATEREPGPNGGDDTGTSEQQGGQAAVGDGHNIRHFHGKFGGQALDLYTGGTRWAPGERAGGENVAGRSRSGPPGGTRTSSASRGGSRLVSGGLAAVDVSDFAGDLGIHSDSSACVLDGQ